MITLMALITTRQKQSVLAAVLCTVLVLGSLVWVWTNAPWVYAVLAALTVWLVWANVRKKRRKR